MNQFLRIALPALVVLFAGCTKKENVSNRYEDTAVKKSTGTVALSQQPARTGKYMMSYITRAESGKAGQTVFFRNTGNKHLDADFVPADPRRGGRTNITYAVDDETSKDNGLTLALTTAAVDRAMQTWKDVKCSKLDIVKVPYSGNLGVTSMQYGFGGNGEIVADIQHSGFLPSAFFDAVEPGGGGFILGITFTFIFYDENGNPSDIDHNGLLDVAFRETYYNDGFNWSADGVSGIDVQTIALHESGHGLSQEHFGKEFISPGNGKINFAPKAVMNASYSGVQRTLTGTDNGGHCSIWASWPKQ